MIYIVNCNVIVLKKMFDELSTIFFINAPVINKSLNCILNQYNLFKCKTSIGDNNLMMEEQRYIDIIRSLTVRVHNTHIT